jgi:dihydrolipoamide dehydrogenase
MTSSTSSYDLIVVGGGPAGYVAAVRAAQLGARVAVAEAREMGGTCLNRGCIPSKALIKSASLVEEAAAARRFGVTFGEPTIDLDGIRKHKSRTVKQLVSGVEMLLKGNRVDSHLGWAKVTSPTTVQVTASDGAVTDLEGKYILLCSGSEPMIPPIPGADAGPTGGIFTSDDAVDLPGPYKSIVIIGAGALGCEFAYVYSRLGTAVHLMEMMPRIVPTEDPEATDLLAKSLKKGGVRIYTGAKVAAIHHTDSGKRVAFEAEGKAGEVEADAVLVAAGRRAVSANMGLEEVGIELDRGRIMADGTLKTAVDTIYGAGDCLRGIGLAHLASHEGIVAVENMMGEGGHVNYDAVPACIFTHPEIGSVGIREAQAKERGIEVAVGSFPFQAIGKATAIGEREGFVKLIADAKTGQLIGSTAIGPAATELIAEITLAISLGATANDVAETIHSHPTLSECVGEAALAVLGRAIHMPPVK